VYSYLDRLPDSESIFVDTVHSGLRFKRPRDGEQVKCNPPSRLSLYDVIFLDEASMLEEEVFTQLFRTIQELPQRPVFVVAADFAQLEAIDRNDLVRLVCGKFATQFELTTVHRSQDLGCGVSGALVCCVGCSVQDPKHLEFVSAIRHSQPSREQIHEYFEEPVARWLRQKLRKCVEFGMEAQERHRQPFVWICNTNKGVAKVSRAALRHIGIELEDIEADGYLGDPSVKGMLRILPRVGVWLRLTRNLDKARGFVNGALGQVVEVFRHPDFFSVRLLSGTLVMVHPVSYGGETFLPCVYGYAVTVRRTQGLTLFHGALFLDGRFYPRPRGHAYVAVSRFR
jgi:hypothetical protein